VSTAIERRDLADPPRVDTLASADDDGPAGRRLHTSPREVDALVRRIPPGKVLTLGALGANLARTHKAEHVSAATLMACLRIVADAADEERASGAIAAPYWRVVADDGALLGELPGGIAGLARRLTAEAVTVLFLGAVPRVTEVSHFAWTPPPLGKASSGKIVAPRR